MPTIAWIFLWKDRQLYFSESKTENFYEAILYQLLWFLSLLMYFCQPHFSTFAWWGGKHPFIKLLCSVGILPWNHFLRYWLNTINATRSYRTTHLSYRRTVVRSARFVLENKWQRKEPTDQLLQEAFSVQAANSTLRGLGQYEFRVRLFHELQQEQIQWVLICLVRRVAILVFPSLLDVPNQMGIRRVVRKNIKRSSGIKGQLYLKNSARSSMWVILGINKCSDEEFEDWMFLIRFLSIVIWV